jgi:hypothetical protein
VSLFFIGAERFKPLDLQPLIMLAQRPRRSPHKGVKRPKSASARVAASNH